jgi:hypothetical protein
MAWTATEIAQFKALVKTANSHFERFKQSSLHNLMSLVTTAPYPTAATVRSAIEALPDAKREKKYSGALTYLRINYPGLDEVKVGGFTYKNFSGTLDERGRLARAQLGVSRCYELVKNCQKAMTKVVANTATSSNSGNWSSDQRKATELFQKWFDNSRKYTSVSRVIAVFNSMEESLRGQEWEIVLYGTPEDPDPDAMGNDIDKAFAFVMPGQNAYRIYLGACFWAEGEARIDVATVTHAKAAPTPDAWREEKKTKVAMDAAIVTTLHELCHVRMISGPTAITDVKPDPYGLGTCKDRAQNAPNLALTNAENYAQFASALLMQKHFF